MVSNFIPSDLSEEKIGDSVSKCKEYLKVAYNKYLYESFKNDPLVQPLEYTPQNESCFGLSKHKKAWLNVPSALTIGYKEWMYKINLCLMCVAHDSFEISIGTDSEKANLQFIRLIENESEREKLIKIFNELNDHFYTHFFCRKGKAPPRKDMKETFVYYQTNKINGGDLEEIRKKLTYWLNVGRSDLIYPHIRIIRRTNVKEEQIPEIINEAKILISFLIDFTNNDFEQQQELKRQKKEEKRLDEEKKEEIQRIKDQLQRRDEHPELVTPTEEQIAQKRRRLKELEKDLKLTDAEKIVGL